MFRSFIKPLASALALTGATAALANDPIILQGINIGEIQHRNTVQPHLPVITGVIGINCPAPAVRSMSASRIGGNLVRIEAEIANIGGVNFQSGEGQQMVSLTDGHGRPIGYRSFVTLAAGDSFIFATERSWNPFSEFQDGFGAQIDYSPDIFFDGNSANDDCRLQDNVASIAPAEINALFN